jgi:hypothetical protein
VGIFYFYAVGTIGIARMVEMVGLGKSRFLKTQSIYVNKHLNTKTLYKTKACGGQKNNII